mmetsp:Transcript_24933/g.72126  ORF Transcript_24933/g.72126 Transcript_24933/m.72126 type:complete len:256 (+) Transcript_24933:2336-3103(+)
MARRVVVRKMPMTPPKANPDWPSCVPGGRPCRPPTAPTFGRQWRPTTRRPGPRSRRHHHRRRRGRTTCRCWTSPVGWPVRSSNRRCHPSHHLRSRRGGTRIVGPGAKTRSARSGGTRSTTRTRRGSGTGWHRSSSYSRPPRQSWGLGWTTMPRWRWQSRWGRTGPTPPSCHPHFHFHFRPSPSRRIPAPRRPSAPNTSGPRRRRRPRRPRTVAGRSCASRDPRRGGTAPPATLGGDGGGFGYRMSSSSERRRRRW